MNEIMVGNKKIKIKKNDKYVAYQRITESSCMFTKKGLDRLRGHASKVYDNGVTK